MKLSFLKNKEVKNAGWIIGMRVFQMLLSLVVSILTARFLGPDNYGLITYGATYAAFFMSLCTLGLNSVIVKDFVDNPDEKGQALGTSIVLRLISSFLSMCIIIVISFFLDKGDTETVLIVALCSVSLVFQAFDTISYYFQSLYQSKFSSVAMLIGYVVTSIYKIILLMLGKSLRWFALATSVDYIAVAVMLVLIYKIRKGPRLSFSAKKGKQLLSKSYHYILSGAMVAIYGQTDRIMLKHMVDNSSVAFYGTAVSISNMWVFVLSAIIDSMYPTILNYYKNDRESFDRKNRQLYCIVFYVSMFVSVLFSIFGRFAVGLLYGESYLPTAGVLTTVTWYTAFSYLGVARNAWLVCENKQKYLKWTYLAAAVMNVLLNAVMIPVWGAVGAGLASLITQICTSILIPALIPGMRPNVKLMLEAIIFKDILPRRTKK